MAHINSVHSSPSLPLYSTMPQAMSASSPAYNSGHNRAQSFARPSGGGGGATLQSHTAGQELFLPGGFGGGSTLRYSVGNAPGGGQGSQQRHSMHVPPSYNVEMMDSDDPGHNGSDRFGKHPMSAGGGLGQGYESAGIIKLDDYKFSAGQDRASLDQQSGPPLGRHQHQASSQGGQFQPRPFGLAPDPTGTGSSRYSAGEPLQSSFANALARSTSLGGPRRRKNDVESGLADMDPTGYDDYPYAMGGSESGRMPSSGMLLGGTVRTRGSDASSTEANHLASNLSGHGLPPGVGALQQNQAVQHGVDGLPSESERDRYRQSQQQLPSLSRGPSAYDPPTIPAPLQTGMRSALPLSPNPASGSVSPSYQTNAQQSRMQDDPWPQYSSRQSQIQGQSQVIQPPSASSYRYSPSTSGSSKEVSPKDTPMDPMLSIGHAMSGSTPAGGTATPLSPTNRRDRMSSSGHSGYGNSAGYGMVPGGNVDHGNSYGQTGGRQQQPQQHEYGSPMLLGASSSSGSGGVGGMNLSPSSGHDLPYLTNGSTFPNTSAVRHQGMRSRSSQHLNTSRGTSQSHFPLSSPASAVEPHTHHGQYGTMSTQTQKEGAGHAANEDERSQRQGFRQVRDPTRDLKPQTNLQNIGRRADSSTSGGYLSLAQTYNICNPSFTYEVAHNPRRVLTKPSKPCHNGGSDNEDYDYILYVNDVLTADNGTGDKYLILDVLGQGTFGQVVKCQNMRSHDIVAVKVVKNKPAYFNQSMMEVAILQLLNTEADKNDEHHILRMLDSFIHHRHLCIVFECLASNLYELIKHNQFRGLSLQLVKMFTAQLLDALTILKDARLIHCDLKPENILLKSLNSPQIKVIDFGSACHERQTVYTYVQSRFYRSPEVLLGLPYSTAIDMWSLGCIIVELFLGLPLFPGTSEYNQLSRITDMLGMPPPHLLEVGKQVNEFFNNVGIDNSGRKMFRLKSMDQFSAEHNTSEQPSKQYFKATTLPEIIKTYTLPKKVTRQSDIDKEMNIRASFIDFVGGLLLLDPIKRWSPQQARLHPFITGERFVGPFDPTITPVVQSHSSRANSTAPDAQTRPRSSLHQPVQQLPQEKYGGLVDAQGPKGGRAYPDAASYNQQVAQYQQYTNAQQQAQAQAAQANRQPFSQAAYDAAAAQYSHSSQARMSTVHSRTQSHAPPVLRTGQPTQTRIPSQGGAAVPASHSAGTFSTMPNGSRGDVVNLPIDVANPPPTSYYPTTRNRANTINQMDVIPPALARLTHLGPADPAGTRSSLTPVLNRDEAIREWERRNATGTGHAKRPSMANPGNAQLEFLQEQAELHHNAWATTGGYGSGGRRTTNASGYSMQPPPPVMIDGPSRSNQHRVGMSGDYSLMPPMMSAISAPNSPRGAGQSSSSRAAHHQSQHSSSSMLPSFPPPAASAFDAYDPRGDAGLSAMMYTPTHGHPMDSSMSYSSGTMHGAHPSSASQQQMMAQGGYGQGMAPMQRMDQQTAAQLPTSPHRFQNVRRRSGQPSQGGNGAFGMYDA